MKKLILKFEINLLNTEYRKLNTLIMFTLCLCASVVKSDTHYVSKKGSNTPPYTTPETAARVIQDAVFAATDGDTVLVDKGTYRTGGAVAPGETLMSRVMVTNSIILKSVNGAKKTKVIGKVNNTEKLDRTGDIRCFYFGTNAQITGFTINNGGAIQGGGIYAANKIVVNHCIFFKCFSDEIGGGAFFNAFSVVSNSTFKRNFAYYNDGGAFFCMTNLIMHNCEIFGNKGHNIISCNGGIISDSTFSKNKIGGGYSVITIFNGILTNCHITKNINPIYHKSGINAMVVCNNSTVVNCLFDKNKDTILSAKNSIIKDCKFYKNNVGKDSDILYARYSIVTNCNFTKNRGYGGIYCNFSTILHCNFNNNTGIGGGIFDISKSTAKNCKIINNKNRESGSSAGISGAATTLEDSEIYNCLIVDNYGYAHDSYDKDIENNFGGGCFCYGDSQLYNCTIVANTIKHGNGGGIYFQNYFINDDGVLKNNVTGMVYNSIISFNKAKKGPQVGGSNYKLINCYLAEAPDFTDYKNGDYHLKTSSPCINAGTNMEWMVGATDLDGNSMPTNGPINLGAFQE